MTKEFKFSVIILSISLLALTLRLPLETVLNTFSKGELLNKLLSGVFIRLVIVICLLSFIIRRGFLQFNGLPPFFTITSLWLLLTPAFITSVIGFSNIMAFKQAEKGILILYTCNAVLIATLEELLLRGIVLPSLLKSYSYQRSSLLKAIGVSSLLFGLAHFVGLVRHPENFYSILSQVIFAIGIGFYLASLLLRTKNILAPVIIHFLIDFSGGTFRLKENISNNNVIPANHGLIDYMPVIILSSVLAAAGIYMLKSVEKIEWINKAFLIKI